MTRKAVALFAGLIIMACDSTPTDLPDLTVAEVTVAPEGRTLVTGESMRLTVYPKTTDGTVLGGRRVDWSSEAPGVATVSSNGTVLAAGPGSTRIRAAVEGKVGSVQVTVITAPLEVATIEILNVPAGLNVGEQVMLEAVLRAADGSVIGGRTITWRSSVPAVATVTVDPNSTFTLLSAHHSGAAVITAEAGGRFAMITVAVNATPTPVGSIALGPSDADVWVGGSRPYLAVVLTPAGEPHPNPPTIVWTVDDPTVASVDATGRVTGLRPGTTHIRATAAGVQAGAKVTVHALLVDTQRFLLEAGVDPDGNAREVVIGTLTWYGDSNEGEAALEILTSGALTLETDGSITTYALQLYLDVVVEGTGARKVGFGSITDTGTVETLLNQTGDAPGLRFVSSSAQNNPFIATLESPSRLILQHTIAAAPLLEYLWVRE
jgi:uncharacterized protein YjdB